MHSLSELLARIPLPESVPTVGAGEPIPLQERCFHEVGRSGSRLVRELGADLPQGHLHVWSGPPGAGKTPLLLTLLHGAAQRGRRVAYATYDLAPESLALRLLAMCSGMAIDRLPDPDSRLVPGDWSESETAACAAAREWLSALPFSIVSARGFSVESLRDRLVRMPFRPAVLAVDYLQAVVRPSGSDSGIVLRQLSELAIGLHLSVICAARAAATESHVARGLPEAHAQYADRVGWIAPAQGSLGLRAEVLENRYGKCGTLRLHLDESCGRMAPAAELAEPGPDLAGTRRAGVPSTGAFDAAPSGRDRRGAHADAPGTPQ